MLIISVATDLALLAAIRLVDEGVGASAAPPWRSTFDAAPTIDAAPPPPAWAICMPGESGEPPATVAITYLDATRDVAVTAPEIRGWFGDLPPTAIQVWRLEQIDGRRRVSFELPATTWPPWTQLAGSHSGAALCDALHRELKAHQVGRPRPTTELTATDRETRSRHDLEFFSARRERLYRTRTWTGTLADLTQPVLDEHQQWIAAALTGAP